MYKPLTMRQRGELENNDVPMDTYRVCYAHYAKSYERRPPSKRSTATANMLKALRLLSWLNTPEDWARLHATENYRQ